MNSSLRAHLRPDSSADDGCHPAGRCGPRCRGAHDGSRVDLQLGLSAQIDDPVLSGNGRRLAFITSENQPDLGDTDEAADIYVGNLRTGDLITMYGPLPSTRGSLPAAPTSLSADGTRVA